jgi:hypothetical protein
MSRLFLFAISALQFYSDSFCSFFCSDTRKDRHEDSKTRRHGDTRIGLGS